MAAPAPSPVSRKSRRDVKVSQLNERKSRTCFMNPFVIAFAFGIASLLAVYCNVRFISVKSPLPLQQQQQEQEQKRQQQRSDVGLGRVCRASTVVMTDATQSYAREAAILLAEQGFHVLACVKTEAQKRSFVYDMSGRKGLEPIVADVADPSQLAELLYRIRQVQRDLRRPLYAVVINSVDLPVVPVQLPPPPPPPPPRRSKTRGGVRRSSGRGPPVNTAAVPSGSVIDVEALDAAYRRFVKGPVRLLQAVTQNDLWGGEWEEEGEEEKGRGDGERGGDGVKERLGDRGRAASCVAQARVVLLSPTQLGCAVGRHNSTSTSSVDPTALSLTSRCAAIGTLHGYLEHSRALLQAAMAIEVVEVFDSGGDSGVNWVVDAACQVDGTGSCIGSGKEAPALNGRFSRKANMLSHSILSGWPQRVIRL